MTDRTNPDVLLDVAAMWWTPDPRIVSKLPRGGRDPMSRCNVCGGWHKTGAVHIDFVGHADLTRAFIEIDPLWQWEPLALDENGLPRIVQRGNNFVMWARVTLLGKSMLAVGTCETNKTDVDKELVGDMLRNAGMRFGIFGALWSKTDGWQDDDAERPTPVTEQAVLSGSETDKAAQPPPQPTTLPPPDDWQTRPLASMTMRELMGVAELVGHAFSGGSKAELIRQLEPLVRAASGEEPWPVEGGGEQGGAPQGSSIAPPRPEPDAKPFEPVVAAGLSSARASLPGSQRKALDSSMKSDQPPYDRSSRSGQFPHSETP